MAEEMTQEDQAAKLKEMEARIKGGIAPHVAEIQKLLDSFSELLAGDTYGEAENEKAFDIMDAIREEQDAIEELLFNLRDLSR